MQAQRCVCFNGNPTHIELRLLQSLSCGVASLGNRGGGDRTGVFLMDEQAMKR